MTIDAPPITTEMPPKSPLRLLHDTQVSAEKFRIGVGNRMSAFERGVDEATQPIPDAYTRVLALAEEIEHEIDKAIAVELKAWPVYDSWLQHVKGIGPSLAGQMLALLLPPIPTKGPSSWYKAAGLAPDRRNSTEACGCVTAAGSWPECEVCLGTGFKPIMRLPRPRAGEGKITYHPYLRRCLFNVATSFVRTGGYYREQYEQRKARLVELHTGQTEWPPHRIDATARWSTVKLFLSHLWEAWCDVEGIARRPMPYAVEHLGHETIIPRPMPADYKGKM